MCTPRFSEIFSINYINHLHVFVLLFFHSEEDDSWYTMQVWTLAAGLGCGIMAHLATRMFSRGVPTPVGGTVPPQNLDSWMNFPFSTNNKMVLVVRTDLRCRPCPLIQILTRFYPNSILILSRFFKNSLYPNLILIFKNNWIKLEKILYPFLSRFSPNVTLILSRFFLDFFETYFILILS